MLKVRLQRYDNKRNETSHVLKEQNAQTEFVSCWELCLWSRSFNKLSLFSGHFTKDCFSAPGLQYALLPEEDDEEPQQQQQQQQQTSTVKPQQDSDKKKKKKKVIIWQLTSGMALTAFFLHLSLGCESFVATPACLWWWAIKVSFRGNDSALWKNKFEFLRNWNSNCCLLLTHFCIVIVQVPFLAT